MAIRYFSVKLEGSWGRDSQSYLCLEVQLHFWQSTFNNIHVFQTFFYFLYVVKLCYDSILFLILFLSPTELLTEYSLFNLCR